MTRFNHPVHGAYGKEKTIQQEAADHARARYEGDIDASLTGIVSDPAERENYRTDLLELYDDMARMADVDVLLYEKYMHDCLQELRAAKALFPRERDLLFQAVLQQKKNMIEGEKSMGRSGPRKRMENVHGAVKALFQNHAAALRRAGRSSTVAGPRVRTGRVI